MCLVNLLNLLILFTSYVSNLSSIETKLIKLFLINQIVIDTSGTTGAPKGIVRDTGGTVVALNWTMEHIFDVNKRDVWFSASDIGWVVGHSFIVYGPLIRGATSIIFEGKPIVPNAGVLWRIVEQYKVKAIYMAPTAVRIIKKEDYEGEYVK